MAHLLELQALAMSLNLPTYLVQDAGLTQVRDVQQELMTNEFVNQPTLFKLHRHLDLISVVCLGGGRL